MIYIYWFSCQGNTFRFTWLYTSHGPVWIGCFSRAEYGRPYSIPYNGGAAMIYGNKQEKNVLMVTEFDSCTGRSWQKPDVTLATAHVFRQNGY